MNSTSCIVVFYKGFFKKKFLKLPNFSFRNDGIVRKLQSGILVGISKLLPNSNFWNGGIKRNWSKISIIFFASIIKY